LFTIVITFSNQYIDMLSWETFISGIPCFESFHKIPECASATVPATMLSDESPSKL